MENTLKAEFRFFREQHDKIFKEYPGKFVVIKGKKVVLAGNSFEDAYSLALASGHKVGSFLIQECTAGDKAFTQTFHSRVVFG